MSISVKTKTDHKCHLSWISSPSFLILRYMQKMA
jgi:hypothetical protein